MLCFENTLCPLYKGLMELVRLHEYGLFLNMETVKDIQRPYDISAAVLTIWRLLMWLKVFVAHMFSLYKPLKRCLDRFVSTMS